MSEKKIVVPDGMMMAAMRGADLDMAYLRNQVGVKGAIEAALRWLSDYPIVPSADDCVRINGGISTRIGVGELQVICVAFQRRMFLAPEEEMIGVETVGQFCSRHRTIGPAVIEAYQRGRNAAK